MISLLPTYLGSVSLFPAFIAPAPSDPSALFTLPAEPRLSGYQFDVDDRVVLLSFTPTGVA